MIKIAEPEIAQEEIKAVNEVLESGILAQGPRVAQLEEDFAQYCGTKYAVAVNSGTAALHAALYAAGVRAGDEVITVPFSFIATINPILMLGAKPVLIDIDPLTFAMDPKILKRAITSKTKAIIPVHLYGQPADMDEIEQIATEHGLKIVEDACQAIGSKYKGKHTGALGDLGCFSLYATKNIMCGEGGMVTTDDKEYANLIRQFRQHGMSAQYEYVDLGYNYRLSDLHAAIAIEQLKKADRFNRKRQENAQKLSDGLKGIPGLVLPEISPDRTHVFHQYTVRIEPSFPLQRHELIAALREEDIVASVYYPRCLHEFEHIASFGYRQGDFPHAEKAAQEVLSLPVHPKVGQQDIERIISVIKRLAHV